MVVAALVVACSSSTAVAAASPVDADAIPVIPCTTAPPSNIRALVPAEAGARSNLQPLWDAGFEGQGVRVAIVELGTAVDADHLAAYQQCLGQAPVPFFAHQVSQQDPPPPTPPPSGESMLDAELIVALAPKLDRLTEFYNADPKPSFEDTLRAALSPEGNGGRRPDIVSISFTTCEDAFGKDAIDRMEVMLQEAAEAGTWVLKGAGDSGSSACAPHGTQPDSDECQAKPHEPLAVGYPASSRWAIAIGGVEVPADVDPVAPATQDEVWNEPCAGGGGGLSKFLAAPPWQATVPVAQPGDAMRMVPDIAALAGSPGYWVFTPDGGTPPTWAWQGVEGDSTTGPLHAGAFAAVRGALAAAGIEPPALLDPVLYELARDPTTYAAVFQDVVQGDNEVFNTECCVATPGYDLTTGLGQLNFAALTDALIARARVAPAPAPAPAAVPVVVPRFTG
jgi:subtilase family serine protease